MGKRQYTLSIKCNTEGCKEHVHYSYDTRKEYNEGYQRHHKTYKCNRHDKSETVFSLENRKIEKTIISGKSKKYPDLKGLFWDNGSSFNFGNGWKAYANDFPEGTQIKITAEIILP